MVKLLLGLSIFIMGVVIGAYGHYVNIHSKVEYNSGASELISQILPYATQEITDVNYSCEGEDNQNVGEVLASIIGGSLSYTISPLSAGCSVEGICSISLSNCKPWQDSECGSRFLLFKKESNGNILPSSFQCIDMP